jgi:hypothetical protein
MNALLEAAISGGLYDCFKIKEAGLRVIFMFNAYGGILILYFERLVGQVIHLLIEIGLFE